MRWNNVFSIILDTCDPCEDDPCEYAASYIDAFQHLQTVVFTIGYGHISPTCSGGRVSRWL